MSSETPELGTFGWVDLTVDDAETIRDFYSEVVGWQSKPLDMGGYSDFVMKTPGGKGVAGVCHARGSNAGLPAKWLMYVYVANLDHSIESCTRLGGQVITGPKSAGGQGRFCVIQDPAGAVLALFESPPA